MKLRTKIGVTALLLVIGLAVFSHFLDWMNRPSDLWLYSGIAGVIVLFVAIPSLVALIWRGLRNRPVTKP